MNTWKFRLAGLALMIIGGFIFVSAIKYITSDWPQIFTGLFAVFCLSMGFGLLLMPADEETHNPPKKNN